jgi:hypothetical protein
MEELATNVWGIYFAHIPLNMGAIVSKLPYYPLIPHMRGKLGQGFM